jgi:hypothetical protein
MKHFCLLIFLTIPAFAQWADFSSLTSSTNLSGAINGKINFQTSSGTPQGSKNCTAGKDLDVDITNNLQYYCTATNTWTLLPILAGTNLWTGSDDFSSATSFRVWSGSGTPSSTLCNASSHVGRLYAQSNAAAINSTWYGCSNTGASTYAWELIQATSGATIVTGLGLTGNGSSGSPASIDTSAVPTFLLGSSTLTFNSGSAMAQSTCNEQTFTITGVVTGDAILLGPPATIFGSGFQWSGGVSAANTVTVALCKITSGSVTPPVAVWTAIDIKHF